LDHGKWGSSRGNASVKRLNPETRHLGGSESCSSPPGIAVASILSPSPISPEPPPPYYSWLGTTDADDEALKESRVGSDLSEVLSLSISADSFAAQYVSKPFFKDYE